jgi:hypothetical protein
MTARTVGSVENDVLIGHNGDLFLAMGAHSVLDYALGKAEVADQSFRVFSDNIGRRAEWSERRGARYLHVIFPDKHAIATDTFPYPAVIRLGDRYIERCSDVANHVLYLGDLPNTAARRCFMRTDTHLSDRGCVDSVSRIVARLLGEDLESAMDDVRMSATQRRQVCGDLGSKLQPPMASEEDFIPLTWGARMISNGLSGNNGLVDLWLSPGAATTKRLLIFGDSFGRGAAKLLSRIFREILFARTPFFHVDMVDLMRPDCVLSEGVERYLIRVLPDFQRPAFQMYPYLGPGADSYKPSREFAETYSAFLSYPRQPYQLFKANKLTAGPSSG